MHSLNTADTMDSTDDARLTSGSARYSNVINPIEARKSGKLRENKALRRVPFIVLDRGQIEVY